MIKKLAPLSPKKIGNTRPSSSRWWFFTSFDDVHSGIEGPNFLICEILGIAFDCDYICQREICPDSQKEHWQGVVRFSVKKRFDTLTKLQPTWHWEKVKNVRKAKAYCCKDETRKDGTLPFGTLDFDMPLKTITTFRDWQQKLWLELANPTDDRCVKWYWESVGNVGKTAFARYMVIKHKAYYVCGSASDMKNGLCNYYIKNQCFPKIVFLDIPRNSLGCSYKGIEQVKNGIFFNTKYEGMMIVFNPPHVVVFANDMPNEDAMSADRWDIVEISGAFQRDGEDEAQVQQVGPDTDSD